MKDVLDPLPGGVIRAKGSAYGTDLRNALVQLQVVDITRNHLSDIALMNEIGQRATGVSDSILGVLSKGGRKTATEVRQSSTFGINRLKTSAEYYSAVGWSPMAQMMVQNSQQFYEAEKKFRIVGNLIQEAGEQFINVDAESIQGFYDFVPIDGTLPIDRLAQANLWKELLAQMVRFPEIAAGYDISRIFAWVAQLAGLKNINQFKIQVRPDQQVADQAQRGNIVPLGGGGGTVSGNPDSTRIPSRPLSGVGPSFGP